MRRFLLTYILLVIVGQLAIQAQVNPNNPYDDRIDEFGNIVDQYGNQIDPAMRPQNPDSSNVEIQGLFHGDRQAHSPQPRRITG